MSFKDDIFKALVFKKTKSIIEDLIFVENESIFFVTELKSNDQSY